jgi:hypothetical protein
MPPTGKADGYSAAQSDGPRRATAPIVQAIKINGNKCFIAYAPDVKVFLHH